MKRIVFVLMFGLSLSAMAQSFTSVTATVTDSDSQVWAAGSVSMKLISPNGPPTVSGVPLTNAQQNVSAVLSAGGVLATSLVSRSSLDQSGTSWSFLICPNASAPCSTVSSTAVTGTSVDLSAALSSGVKAPRFNGGPGAYGYNNAEVLGPIVGTSYFNVIAPGTCTYAVSGWVCAGGGSGSGTVSPSTTAGPNVYGNTTSGSTTVAPLTANNIVSALSGATNGSPQAAAAVGAIPTPVTVSYLWGLGDSFIQGYGSSNFNAQAPKGPIGTTGIIPMVAALTHSPFTNLGVQGYTAVNIATKQQGSWYPNNVTPVVTVMDAGNNDGAQDTCGGAAGTACVKTFQFSLSAIEAYASISYQFRQWASTAAKTGTWAQQFTYAAPPGLALQGTPVKATASGSTLTFTVPSSASTKIGVTYQALSGSTGAATISIDGVLQTDGCSGTTSFASTQCAGSTGDASNGSPFRQEFTVAANQAHTVIITTTNANGFTFNFIDQNPTGSVSNANAVFVAGPIASYQYASVYNVASKAIANQFLAEGSPVYFVDLINGTPGVNTTTDISTTATANCPASTMANHPNDCGYLHFLQTILNTETAVGYQFTAPDGGDLFLASGIINGPISAQLGSQINSTALRGILTYNFGTLPQFGVTAIVQDASTGNPWSGQYTQGFYEGAGQFNCTGLVTSSGVITTTQCYDTSGNGYQLGSQTIKGAYSSAEGPSLASAATIAPTSNFFHITGTTGISTITPLATWATTVGSGLIGGILDFITDSTITFSAGTGVGQLKAGFTSTAGTPYHCVFTPSTGLYYCK